MPRDKSGDKLVPGGVRLSMVRIGRQGLHWIGKDKDGVSIWRGTWTTLPKWFCTMFKLLGGTILTGGVVALALGVWEAAIPMCAAGLIHTGLGHWMDRWRMKLDSYQSVEQLAEQFRLSPTEIEAAAKEKGIRPAMILNDEPIYDLSKFGPAGVLLRPAANPDQRSTLLRPAAGVMAVDEKNLLRPAGLEEGNSQSPMQERRDMGNQELYL